MKRGKLSMKKKTKRCVCLFLALCMCFGLYVPSIAAEPEVVEIAVTSEQDILAFLHSDAFDPHVAYSFVYPDSPVMARALCPKCGYNTLMGKISEDYDLCHPDSQGMVVFCPTTLASDVLYVLLTHGWQYCKTCGYQSNKAFIESKFYICCGASEGDPYATELTSYDFVATDYKTKNDYYSDIHETKKTWYKYYNDPHYV